MSDSNTDDRGLEMYVIYIHPDDYPKEYVVRIHTLKHTIDENGKIVAVVTANEEFSFKHEHLAECREFVANLGLTNIGREQLDDPVILEVWI